MFVIWRARTLTQILIAAATVVLFMAVFYWQSGAIATLVGQQPPSAIYKVDTNRKIVALTFDISWGDQMAPKVLDVLKNKGVTKATFFLSGPWTLQKSAIAKRIRDMGYEIGSHGYKHDNFTEHSNDWIRSQVTKAEQAIYDVTGVKTRLIRTPNGDFDKRVLRTLHDMGYTVIQWHTDSLDWKNPGVGAIAQRVLTRAVPGDIILLHASDTCKQTDRALPAIIDGLRQKGFEFVTVSELLQDASPKSKLE
ncbi:polysaccharide deacetylase family sporulation protein PdaB [Kyrpidia tusciae]|uniref:Polysaccharide deacetylase n=1 Tax=Kyrpidia tusciae (strain DSM 2912 / NBRC 15312 / T2) TaxID=562970 RepID=D5WS83_KYRT2|nr:polysaccharide deacetylase family sporulation protein PdaB [Kyrpidia tusciae]ADG04968.1 polysaccharide deacetylase [Kyrpidia tusciae DSM 2912]